MTLHYRNDLGDLVALYQYHLNQTASFRKMRRTALALPLTYMIVGLAVDCFKGFNNLPRTFARLTIGLPWLLLVWMHYRRFARKTVQRQLRENPQPDVLCEHSAELSDRGITITTGASTDMHLWSGILRTGVTADHLFLYTEAWKALILPRRDLGNEAFAKAARLARHYAAAPTKLTQ